jgi:VIT1/CCC1 family predicted Fe2+/Mn2+ transporter
VTDGERVEVHHQHRDVAGGWLRPTVFGMMDGLVSNFALIAGVAGAGSTVSRHAVTLAGLAGLVGGAFSMATGEYVSVQSQNESARAEIEVERRELRRNSAAEQAELAQMYVQRGVEADLASRVAAQLSRDPDQALDIHVREELGVSPHALPSPWVAAGSSLLSFSVGALLPLLPYVAGVTELWVSAVVSIAALFGAGALTAQFTSRSWQFSAIRQVLLGGFAAAVTYGVGQAFGAVTG